MTPDDRIKALEMQRATFRAFLISRLGSDAEVDDILQNSLIKALRSEPDKEEKLTAWFYRVLRNSLTDHVRGRISATKREQAWVEQAAGEDKTFRSVCGCLDALVGFLPAREAQLVRKVELEGEKVAEAARQLGLTANNASVILHRARAALKKRLEEFCGACASGACLDCDCKGDDSGGESQRFRSG